MENLGDDLEARGLVYNPLDGRVRPEWAVANDQLRDYYDYEWGALATTEAEFLSACAWRLCRLAYRGIWC